MRFDEDSKKPQSPQRNRAGSHHVKAALNSAAFIIIVFITWTLIRCGSWSTPCEHWLKGVMGGNVTKTIVSKVGSSETRKIIDITGREVVIPKTPERVVTLSGWITEIVCDLQADSKLVGIDSLSAGRDRLQEFNWRVYPFLLNMPGIDHSSNGLQYLVQLKPDVIIADQGSSYLRSALKDTGIPIVSVDCGSVERLLQSIMVIGDVVSASEEAHRMVALIEAKLLRVASRTDPLPPELRTKALYSEWVGDVAGSDTFQGELIEMAGGSNVAQEAGPGSGEISVEQLSAWNPEVIFTAFGGRAASFLNDARLSSIDAISHGHVYKLPDDWIFGTPRFVCALLWMAPRLQPELFADLDVNTEIDDFFQTLYHMPYKGFPWQGPVLEDNVTRGEVSEHRVTVMIVDDVVGVQKSGLVDHCRSCEYVHTFSESIEVEFTIGQIRALAGGSTEVSLWDLLKAAGLDETASAGSTIEHLPSPYQYSQSLQQIGYSNATVRIVGSEGCSKEIGPTRQTDVWIIVFNDRGGVDLAMKSFGHQPVVRNIKDLFVYR